MLKVLHVNDYRSAGGCEAVIHDTIELLRRRGVEAQLFTSEDVEGHRRTPASYVHNTRACRALERALDGFRPDVVHLHNFYHELSPAILALLARVKSRQSRGPTASGGRAPLRVVMTVHDFHLVSPSPGLCTWNGRSYCPADPDRISSAWYRISRRWDHRGLAHSMLKLLQHSVNYTLRDHRDVIDLLICPSRFAQQCMKPLASRSMFLPNPAPTPDLYPPPKPREPLQWVFAGRIEPEKGVLEFLRAIPAAFPGRCTIIGDGSLLEACRKCCIERGLHHRVDFTGRLPREETRRRIAAAHVMILPSRCAENAPLSLLEALASRTSILVTRLGGMREIVESSGVGCTFIPDDPESLAEAIAQVEDAFAAGALNAFDASSYLARRSPELYVERLLEAYLSSSAGLEAPRPIAAAGVP